MHPKIVQAPTEDKEVMVGVAREENMVVEVRVYWVCLAVEIEVVGMGKKAVEKVEEEKVVEKEAAEKVEEEKVVVKEVVERVEEEKVVEKEVEVMAAGKVEEEKVEEEKVAGKEVVTNLVTMEVTVAVQVVQVVKGVEGTV